MNGNERLSDTQRMRLSQEFEEIRHRDRPISGPRPTQKGIDSEDDPRLVDHDTDPDVFMGSEEDTEEILLSPEVLGHETQRSDSYPNTAHDNEKTRRAEREAQKAIDIPLYQERIEDLTDEYLSFIRIATNKSAPATYRIQARVQAAKLKKELDALLPIQDVQRERKRLKQLQLKHWNEEFERLMTLINDETVHYTIRMKARLRIREVVKKIRALESLGLDHGILSPTAEGLSRKIDELYERRDQAIRISQDPSTTLGEKRRAKYIFVHLLSRIEEKIKQLPQNTDRQRQRKQDLETRLEPWLKLADLDMDWADARLTPMLQAQQACADALATLYRNRNDHTIQDLLKKVQTFREALIALQLKQDPLEENPPEEEAKRIHESLFGIQSGPPRAEKVFLDSESFEPLSASTSAEDKYKNDPSLVAEAERRYGILHLKGSFEDTAHEASVRTEKNALDEYARPKEIPQWKPRTLGTREDFFSPFTRVLKFYETRADFEVRNNDLKENPYAVSGLREDHTLDDIARIQTLREEMQPPQREKKEEIPSAPPTNKTFKLRSVHELHQDILASRRGRLHQELNELKQSLCKRLGKKDLATNEVPSPSLWGRVKDFWHRNVSKNYVSNADLITKYNNKRKEIEQFELTAKDPAREVTESRLLKIEKGKLPELTDTIESGMTSHAVKVQAIQRYHDISARLSAFTPSTFEDRLFVKQMHEEIGKTSQAIKSYQNRLQSISRSQVQAIQRAKGRASQHDQEILQNLLIKEWEATAPARLLRERRGSIAFERRINALREAHELEYQSSANPLLEQTGRGREKLQMNLKKLYDLAYDRTADKKTEKWAA